MASSIQPTARSGFSIGSVLNQSAQALRNLVHRITTAVVRFFRTICPFLFGPNAPPPSRLRTATEKRATPLFPPPSTNSREPAALPPSFRPKAAIPEPLCPVSPLPSPEPAALPTPSSPTRAQSAAFSSPPHGGMTETVRALWEMGTPRRNAFLDQIDPPGVASSGEISESGLMVQESAPFRLEDSSVVFCLAIVAVESMKKALLNNTPITREFLDQIQEEGLRWHTKHAGEVMQEGRMPYEQVLQNLEEFTPAPLKPGRTPRIEGDTIYRLTIGLRERTKEDPYLAAILFEGDRDANPRIYGIVATRSRKESPVHFHLFDFYQKDQPGMYQKFTSWSRFVNCFKGAHYSMMALKPIQEEGDGGGAAAAARD